MRTTSDSIDKITFRDYLIMFLLLCISGNPVFIYADTKWLFVISAIVLALLCLVKRVPVLDGKSGRWIGVTVILFLLQFVVLEIVSIPANINFICRLWIAFMAASFFGKKFREVYLMVMTFVCLVSIPLYLTFSIAGVVFGPEFNRYNTILIYNQCFPNLYSPGVRNSGMFWEPGAFQGYIMLVPLLFYDKLLELWNQRRIVVLILFLAFILTQSTTAYVTFFIFISLTVLKGRKLGIFVKTALIAAICAIAFYAVWELDFIGDKLTKQIEDAQGIQVGDVSWDRMGAMMVDLQNIARHPFIGNGFVEISKYGSIGELMRGAGNGLTGAINMLGIPFILLYFISLFKNYECYPMAKRWIFLFVISLLLYGEYFLNYPLFWSLLFIQIPTKNENYSSSFNRI